MRKKLFKNKSGITLIALVVTIVVLLILAGVTINFVLGENGILSQAKNVQNVVNEARDKDLQTLAELENEINGILKGTNSTKTELPENTAQNPQAVGTQVALKDGWGTETVTNIQTGTGKEIVATTKVATVYAVSVGNGDTVPVPKDFYYVGGDLNSGVIISDNPADKYEAGTDKTTHDYAPNLVGNQFVWIPATTNSYQKTTNYTKATSDATWGTSSQNAYYDTSTNSAEYSQIEKYGGFYVGRYEAGTSDIQGINFSSISTTGWTTSDANYNNISGGKVTSKANEIPYYHADYTTAVKAGRSMYAGNSYVSSGILTGTMWDVMINKMNEKTSCSLSSGELWGNYWDKAWTITRGKYCEVNSSGGHGSWSNVSTKYDKSDSQRAIFSTGANSSYEKYHIYDVSGNLWEWTQEMAFNNNNVEWFMLRGGSFLGDASTYPASYRNDNSASATSTGYGFRVALYLK